MCGFAGVYGCQGLNRDVLEAMGKTLLHRGPDEQHIWVDAEACVGLAHTRLSILELSAAGSQPMVSATGRFVIAFNGEVYNHCDLRADLEERGRAPQWRGRSDTETLLAGFEAFGIEETLRKVVGMFAFGVWDRNARLLTLGRDRLGEKPLYYGWQGSILFFGSELKAFRAHPAFKGEIDPDAVTSFMRFGYVPSPRSIYRGIHKLPPGTILSVGAKTSRDTKPVPYWSLREVAQAAVYSPFTGSDEEALKALDERLRSATALQSFADVPLGAFLSGGIDSSLVVAAMQAGSSRPVRTFTIGFREKDHDEARYARAVSDHLGTDHTELYVSPAEARSVIPLLPTLYDEPFADSSQIPTYLVSRLARQSVTVSLSGDGGDELFGGYNRHVHANSFLKLPRRGRRMVAAVFDALSADQWNSAYGTATSLLPARFKSSMPGDHIAKLSVTLRLDSPAEIYRFLASVWSEPQEVVQRGSDYTDLVDFWSKLDIDDPQQRMMLLDTLTYLPDDILCKVDRAAMAVSLETRIPFLDHRIVEFAWSLPLRMKIRNGQGKWILRQLLEKYVPRALTDHPKTGFAVPIGAWLRGPLREWAEELISPARLESEGYLNARLIRQRWSEHISGRRNRHHQLWNVLMFQAWLAQQA